MKNTDVTCIIEDNWITDLPENIAFNRVFNQNQDEMLDEYIKKTARLQFGKQILLNS